MSHIRHTHRSGEPDPDFAPVAIPSPIPGDRGLSAQTVLPLAGGGFIVGCQNDIYRQLPCLVRIRPDRSIDTDFGDNGFAYIGLTDSYMLAVYPLDNGKLLARLEIITTIEGRRVTCLALACFTAQGLRDQSFGDNGMRLYPLPGPQPQWPEPLRQLGNRIPETRSARFPHMEYGDLQVLEDGKLLVLTTVRDVAENVHRAYVLRLTPQGEPDPTFNDGGLMEPRGYMWFMPYRLMLQADGKMLISGEHPGIPFIARFDKSGALDSTFAKDGYFTDLGLGQYGYSSFVKLLPDAAGNIVTVGQRGGRTFPQGRGVVAVCKISADGKPVFQFNSGKSVLLEPRERGDAVLYTFDAFIDSEKRIVLGGRHLSPELRIIGFMGRLLKDGQADTSVSDDGLHYYDDIISLIAMAPSPQASDRYYATAMTRDFEPERLYRLIA